MRRVLVLLAVSAARIPAETDIPASYAGRPDGLTAELDSSMSNQ